MTTDRDDELAARRDERSDLRADLARAARRLALADLDKDRRQWTQEERDELRAAEAEYDAALAAFEKEETRLDRQAHDFGERI